MVKNSRNSLSRIQRKISTTQIILIVSLSILLAIVGILISIRSERDKIDKNFDTTPPKPENNAKIISDLESTEKE